MKQAEGIVELLNASRSGSGFVTNCFLTQESIHSLTAAGRLEAFSLGGALCLLVHEDSFGRFYFSAPSVETLREAMVRLPFPSVELIADIAGRDGQTDPLVEALASAGFSLYRDFQRMSRLAGDLPPARDKGTQGEAVFATAEDIPRVQELITSVFEARAEHLPALTETTQAVLERKVLVARSGSEIAAMLFFSRDGLTTVLRFWLVLPQFRGMGLGDMLVRRYFSECGACRRFMLWVRCGNDEAIRRYRDYGYREDGTIDRILRKETR